MTQPKDEGLLEYATERQAEYLTAYWEHGSYKKAAASLGVHPRAVWGGIAAVRNKATRQGYAPEHDMTRTAPDGFHVKGVSTYYDKEGKTAGQWVKTSIDRERQAEILQEAIRAMAAELPALPANTYQPADTDTRLMACYPIGDLHVGMLSWPDETGEDWNLELAERIQCGAMARLVELSPACDRATIINLGDWFHYDNMDGVTTRSGHSLDTDGRYAKMAHVGVKIMRQCIESALKKHKHVRVLNVIGNHDDTGAIMLSVCLAQLYADEPRVTVDTSPAGFMYFRHGRTLVGCHHGHSCKADRLPGVMAADRPHDWGDSTYRYWWIGHVHHQSVKDYAGVSVESFRTLAAKDAYAHWGGYRAPRDMKCIVLDVAFGEVARHTVNPLMLMGEFAREAANDSEVRAAA